MGSIGVHRRETKGDIGENERSELNRCQWPCQLSVVES
jgi:hypothetical protein